MCSTHLDPLFDFFAWLYLYDWALGYREVISFQGDLILP